jgi:hypothetical protein
MCKPRVVVVGRCCVAVSTPRVHCIGTWGYGGGVATYGQSHTVPSLTNTEGLAFQRHLSSLFQRNGSADSSASATPVNFRSHTMSHGPSSHNVVTQCHVTTRCAQMLCLFIICICTSVDSDSHCSPSLADHITRCAHAGTWFFPPASHSRDW